MRRRLGAIAFAITLAGLFAPAITHAESARTTSMQFALWREDADACKETCRTWISASGTIRSETPSDFEAFAAKNDIRGATIAFESEGGSVLGAMALGRAIRNLGMTTTVGHTIPTSSGHATLAPEANCESMCAFVLLAGVKRVVPAEANVRVHQIWLGDRRDDAVAATYSAEDMVLVQRDIGKLAQYTFEMGGGVDLLEVALRIPPWEPMRTLTRDEMRRMRIDTADAQEPKKVTPSVGASAAPVTSGVRKMSLRAERGWSMAQGAGAPVLTRKHPLTIEGEIIGSFDLSVGCGQAPGQYTVAYSETRRSTHSDGPSPLKRVEIRIGQKTASFPIGLSNLEGRAVRETTAGGNIPASLLKPLGEGSARSLVVTTLNLDGGTTVIRLGNSGVAAHLPQLAAACVSQTVTAHAGMAPRAQ